MALEDALRDVVGSRHVLTDPDLRAPYERDWTGRWGAAARAVVRPACGDEVAAVVAACAAEGAPLVPQGGNTGLVGGGVPRGGEVVLSLRRLDDLGEVDLALGEVEAGAGATLAALHAHARAAGLDAGLDFGARDSATLGGVVACDAGGARALRHGTARARVAGLEAVLGGGTRIRRLAGLAKDNAGYGLPSLLVGSEGTLGVLTRVRWRLVPLLSARVAALVALESAEQAAALLAALRAEAPSLEACDFFLDDGLELVLAQQRREAPLPRAPVYVLAECAAKGDPTGELAAALERAGVEDAVVADDTASRERLWALREGHSEAINAAGVPHKLDVGVPLAALPGFLRDVPAAVADAAPGARTILFGHLGDGNVHVNVLGAPPDDERVDAAVLRLVLACGGTISAEHGVGVAKAPWLEEARGAGEVAAMRAVKDALDPGAIMNPGAVLAAPPAGSSRAPAASAAPAAAWHDLTLDANHDARSDMTGSSTQGIRTVLHRVSDLAAAKPVYAALLGAEPEADSPYYVGFEAEGQHIGLVPAGGPQGMTSPVAYWHVADIEAKLAEVTAAGATVNESPRDVGGGRLVATVTDPDGNILGLLQDR